MQQDNGALFLDLYRTAAKDDTVSARNYKGLKIHALPIIHEEVAKTATRKLAPSATVLDIASGSGALCLRLRDSGFTVTGCDLVGENFRLHRTSPFVELNLNLAFSQKFDQTFDAITATEIVEHVENPRHFLRQCFALLNPGGTLILTTPNIDSAFSCAFWIRTGTFRWFDKDYYLRDGHITPIPVFLLQAAFAEAGFEGLELTSIGEPDSSFLSWWRLHAFAWLIRKLDGRKSPQKEILFAVARKPRAAGGEAA